MIKLLERIVAILKKPEICEYSIVADQDPHVGKQFKHYRNGKLYRYLFSAINNDSIREDLVVVYQNVESGKRYIRKWNNFFSTTLYEGNRVARFQEQE